MSLRNFFYFVLFSWIWRVHFIKSLSLSEDSNRNRGTANLSQGLKIIGFNDNVFNKVTEHRRNLIPESCGHLITVGSVWDHNLKINGLFQIHLHSLEILKLIRLILVSLFRPEGSHQEGEIVETLDREPEVNSLERRCGR